MKSKDGAENEDWVKEAELFLKTSEKTLVYKHLNTILIFKVAKENDQFYISKC